MTYIRIEIYHMQEAISSGVFGIYCVKEHLYGKTSFTECSCKV